MNKLINIFNDQSILTVSSREVALNFEKRHDNVLRDIDNLVGKLRVSDFEGTPEKYFIPEEYEDKQGKSQREFLITRNGFTLLIMGFTGDKAFGWKLQYIEAFNKMEKMLSAKERRSQLHAFTSIGDLEDLLAEDFDRLVPKHLTLEEGRSWFYRKVYEAWEKEYDKELQKEERKLLNERLNQAMLERGEV